MTNDYQKDEPKIEKKLEEIEKEMQEETENKGRFQPLSITDILNAEEMEESFLVGKLIPLKGITAFSGYPSSGKSWVLLYISYCVASGKPLFDRYSVAQGSVLIIDEEAGIGEFKRRLKLMNIPVNLPIYLFSQQGFKVDDKNCLDNLLRVVREKEIKLVIFDPFSAIHSKIENSAEEMQKVMEYLQKFNMTGATVVFAHHHRKDSEWKTADPSQSLRGSSVLFSRPDSHFAVKKEAESESAVELVITQDKLRRGKAVSPFQVKLSEENGIISLEYQGEVQEEKKKIEEAKEIILNFLKEAWRSRSDILAMLKENKIGGRNGSEALRELEKDGKIKMTQMGRENFYYLPEKETEKS